MDFTHFLAAFFGIIIVIFSLSMLVHKEMYMNMVRDLEAHRSIGYVLGLIGTFVGLYMVFAHNIWYGSFLTILVTLVGWVILLKGVAYLLLPVRNMSRLLRGIAFERHYQIYAIVALLVGLYLAIAGFAW